LYFLWAISAFLDPDPDSRYTDPNQSGSRYTDPNQSGSRYTEPNQSGSRSSTLIKTYLHGLIPEKSLNLRMGEGRPVGMEKSTEDTKVEVVIKQFNRIQGGV
jgi:hypothetical protein